MSTGPLVGWQSAVSNVRSVVRSSAISNVQSAVWMSAMSNVVSEVLI